MKESYKYHGLLERDRKQEGINENIVNTYLKKIRKTLNLNSRDLTRSILIMIMHRNLPMFHKRP